MMLIVKSVYIIKEHAFVFSCILHLSMLIYNVQVNFLY